MAQVAAREQNEQKRLLSRHKNRASEADKMSRGARGGGYDHYRSDNYLAGEQQHVAGGDHYSKNGVSLDSGSNNHHGGGLR